MVARHPWRRSPHNRIHHGTVPPESPGFPKIWQYYNTSSSGSPVLISPGVYDDAKIDVLAKAELVQVHSVPWTNLDAPANLHIFSRLREKHPGIKIQTYNLLELNFVSLSTTMYGRMWDIIRGATDGVDKQIYRVSNPAENYVGANPFNIFWSIDKGTAVSQVGDLVRQVCTRSGAADHMYWDFCIQPYDATDCGFAAAGYASFAALAAAINAGISSLIDNLHATGTQMWGNTGSMIILPVTSLKLDGELFEDFDNGSASLPGPNGNPSTFDGVMALLLTRQGTSPTGNGSVLLKTEEANLGEPYSYYAADAPSWHRAARSGLACASIAGGWSYTGDNGNANGLDTLRWTDEYWVDSSGVTDANAVNIANKGWLGQPTEFGYRDASGIWVRHFQNGVVLATPNGFGNKTITLERPYKRILGVHDPVVNDGSIVQTVTIGPKDGRFLKRI